MHFLFNAAPVAFRPGELDLTTGKLPVDLAITCIGYTGEAFPKAEEVFAVGWAKRGPTGTIPTNRADGHAVAQEVVAWLKERDPKSGPDPLPLAVDAGGLAPHRQARDRGRRGGGPAAREVDRLAGPIGRRAGRLTALFLLLAGSQEELSC